MFTKRLKTFINHQNLSVLAFERKCGVKQGTISRAIKNNTALTSTNLSLIANHWKELDMNWLLKGKGGMIEPSKKVESILENIEPLLFKPYFQEILNKDKAQINWQRKQIEHLTLIIQESLKPEFKKLNNIDSKFKYSIEDSLSDLHTINNSDIEAPDLKGHNENGIDLPKFVTKNYKYFNAKQNATYSEEEAVRLIASALSRGGELQKDISLLRDTYHAVWRLIDFGFRETSVQLAESLVKQAEWYQKYSIAQDVCEELEMYYSLFGDREAVEKYATLYLRYKDIREHEYKAKKLYKEIVYCYKRGLPIDTDRIMSILLELEKKLPKDNLCYHHIFFEFKSLILKGEALENLYLEAISYFESLHFRHTTYISVFIRDLIGYYIDSKQPIKARVLIRSKLGDYEVGSTPWFRFMMIKCNYLLNQKDENTFEVVQEVINHAKFDELPEDTQIEWNSIWESSIELTTNAELRNKLKNNN